ncbi:MAG TPA: hypothetical protein VLG11_00135 [Candidatus Saccharimonadales bacterium]|nr:hypothetical protein [Candidatus Saccharimonadales bacterium]
MRAITLPEDYAIVLQQVDEIGEEDFTALAESLRYDRKRLAHIVQALRNKGLISVTRRGSWIRLSTKGRQLIAYLWPESRMGPSMA